MLNCGIMQLSHRTAIYGRKAAFRTRIDSVFGGSPQPDHTTHSSDYQSSNDRPNPKAADDTCLEAFPFDEDPVFWKLILWHGALLFCPSPALTRRSNSGGKRLTMPYRPQFRVHTSPN